jgi:5-methylcytosine-specific restriction endonuclease McrA
MTYISVAVRQRVAEAARHQCGYCQTQAVIIGMPLELDHLIPEAAGGSSDEANLWLACSRCNRYKGDQTHAVDEETGELVPLFNPRRQRWTDHFAWAQEGLYIVGLTPIGRATVAALQVNNPFVVHSRQVWIACDWHPPKSA